MQFDHQPTLTGDLLTLRPLEQSDFQALFKVASDPLIWQQHPVTNRYQESVFRAFFDESILSGGALIALDNKTNAVIGSSRYHGYSEAASEIEIGWTFLSKAYWGGAYNGEMKRLMFIHALQYVDSIILLVGPDNVRSRRAIEKVGAKRDGARADGSGLASYLYRVTAADLTP